MMILDGDTQENQQHADNYRRKQDSAPEMVPLQGRVLIFKVPSALLPILSVLGTQSDFDTQIRNAADAKAGSRK
jgi:hypothetical protein